MVHDPASKVTLDTVTPVMEGSDEVVTFAKPAQIAICEVGW